RLQCLSEGNRERDRRHAGRDRIRRDRRTARGSRRGRHGCRGVRQEREDQRKFGAEGARRTAGKIQDAEAGDRGRRIAAQCHGQGAEEYFARYLFEDLREVALPCRPRERGDPYSAAEPFEEVPVFKSCFSNYGRWLWVT